MWPLLLLLACGDDTTTTADSSTSPSDDTGTPPTGDTGTPATGDNTDPTCAITGPEDGAFGEEGDSVSFLGTADDAEQSASSLAFTWSSDEDGELGSGNPTSAGEILLATDELSPGTHVITLTVEDNAGGLCSDAMLYSVGQPPVATITGPADDTTVDEGDALDVTGQVSDESTDATDLEVVWSSDLDGDLDADPATSSGALAFTTDSLSVGRHTLSLTVTDTDGLFAVDAIQLTVNGLPSAPTLALSPEDPDTTDDLVVTVETDSEDPDGDPVSYTYAWDLFGSASSESTDARLPAEATTRGDTWTVTVTPRDDRADGTAATASVTVGNAAPSLTGATISPSPAGADDTLTCTAEGWSDPDGDADASTYAWTVDGTTIGTGDTLTGGFGGDDTVTCTVTPHDGLDAGTPVSAVTTIGNSAPSVAVVTISPDPAEVGDTLTCAWSGFDDADGDTDQSFATWTVGGTPAGSGTTLSSGFVGTDTVTCTITPYDGASTGTPVDTSILVSNSVPSLTSATLSPDPATAEDTLVCSAAGWTDADGHSDQSTWSWRVNGSEVGTDTWLAGAFSGGDLVTCTVTPDDGHDTGTPVSDTLTITNSAPAVSDVAIDPDPAVAGDSVTCTWTFEDADGDTDRSTVAWTLNGSPAGSSTTLSTTLVRDDVVTCTVTPSDGSDTGTAASASLTVDNSAPEITTVSIAPSDPTAEDGLSCSWSGYSDADGDSDVSTLAWTINGVSAGTAPSLSSGYVGGDTVACAVTPSDGVSTGTAVSDSVVIANTPPELASVSVSPADPTVDDTLSCTPGTTTDADGTSSFTYTYDWSVSGVSGVGTTNSLAGAFTRGDSVVCTVTPSDGDDTGDPVDSAAVTVANAPPVVDSVTLSPTSVDTEDTVSASVSTSDADGDSVGVTYAWFVDGVEVAGETTASLSGADHFDKDQTVQVEVTPDDGTDLGTAATSSVVTVANSAPSAPTVRITPEDPKEGTDDLFCEVTSESTDPDGDSVSYAATWTVDGSLWTGSTSSTDWSGDTIRASNTLEAEVWECTMTPDDGDDDGDTATDSVVITGGTCTALISSVDSPTSHASWGTTYGAWFADPAETLGAGLYWSMNNHQGTTIERYESFSDFTAQSYSSSTTLPYDWDGTGAVAWDGYLYYNRGGTNDLVKVDLSTNSVVTTVNLADAGYRNDCHWQWGGYSDIDFELDEHGLWVIYGDSSDGCNIKFVKVDADLNIEATYTTSAGDRSNYGNAWMVDGVLYVTDSYSSVTTTISYAYDTCDGVDWNPGITFYNDYSYNSSIKYNPSDQLLYAWDNSHKVTYVLNF